MAKRETSGEKVAKNLIKTYGFDNFMRLITMFNNNISCSHIATEFNVTRQRVWQWKHKLGKEQTIYYLQPEVESLLNHRHLKI